MADFIDAEKDARTQAVLDAYKPICLCNKIRKGIVMRAIQAGAKTFEMVRRRTRVGTGPCGAQRCGPMVHGLLGEPVETCRVCGWSILKGPPPMTCPRCGIEHGTAPLQKEVDLIMFDLDGTLANTGQDITDAVNHTRASLSLRPLSLPAVMSNLGLGLEFLIRGVLPLTHHHAVEQAAKRFMRFYSDHLLDTTVLYPHVLETLNYYGSKRKAVISNKPASLTLAIVQGLGIENYFDHILGGDSTAQKKPHAEPLNHVLSLLNVAPERALMVGDDEPDVKAGKSAGVRTCGVTYGLGNLENLIKARPDIMIEDLLELKHHYR